MIAFSLLPKMSPLVPFIIETVFCFNRDNEKRCFSKSGASFGNFFVVPSHMTYDGLIRRVNLDLESEPVSAQALRKEQNCGRVMFD